MASKKKVFRGKAKQRPRDPEALFLPYQTAWILDESTLKLMEKCRQAGISWATGYRSTRETAKVNRSYDTWVSSRDEGQAILYLEDCKKFAKMLQLGARDMGERIYDDEKGKPFKAFDMKFDNDMTLHSMSSNPDAQAGKRGTRVLDEFALHRNPKQMYDIAYPGITWGGQMEIISTHRGNLNFFNTLVKEIKERGNPKKFSLHTVTLQLALEQGFLYKLQQRLGVDSPDDPRLDMDEGDYFNLIRSQCSDEESFLQEYCCVPADDSTAFLSWDLISAAEYDPNENWQLPLDQILGDLYLGVDVGRRHDLTVFWLIEKNGWLFTRREIEMKNARFAEQETVLYQLLSHPKLRRCCIDSTGLGMQMAERAAEKFGPYKVEAVHFTAPVKEELAYPVRALMEERKLRIPQHRDIRADLRGVKKEYSKTGNIRFTADTGPDGHSDRFWALALAIHASKSTGTFVAPTRVISDYAMGSRYGREAGLLG